MKTFSKLRELVTLAGNLEREARRMQKGAKAGGSEGRMDRMAEAEQYRMKAQWLAGRVTGEQYGEERE